MQFHQCDLRGVYEITLEPRSDERGFFMRTFDRQLFDRSGINVEWVQENHSRSIQKGVIRGLHFQFAPHAETKLIRCIRGGILDICVDLRTGSPTFGEWRSFELTEGNKKMVLIPRGCAHGFCTLTDESEVVYKVDNYYTPQAEGGVIWNDPDLQITWPAASPLLSEKDSKLKTLKEFKAIHKGLIP
ncbi:MAG TPA: dTDP-4-dehydrorhamnose 3,5-epimerase [Bacteroidota bacterium]|nr:dTDP-4-dehydrorhamnose 3,5-epimerase [Bacteroidota bacterium]